MAWSFLWLWHMLVCLQRSQEGINGVNLHDAVADVIGHVVSDAGCVVRQANPLIIRNGGVPYSRTHKCMLLEKMSSVNASTYLDMHPNLKWQGMTPGTKEPSDLFCISIGKIKLFAGSSNTFSLLLSHSVLTHRLHWCAIYLYPKTMSNIFSSPLVDKFRSCALQKLLRMSLYYVGWGESLIVSVSTSVVTRFADLKRKSPP